MRCLVQSLHWTCTIMLHHLSIFCRGWVHVMCVPKMGDPGHNDIIYNPKPWAFVRGKPMVLGYLKKTYSRKNLQHLTSSFKMGTPQKLNTFMVHEISIGICGEILSGHWRVPTSWKKTRHAPSCYLHPAIVEIKGLLRILGSNSSFCQFWSFRSI